MIPKMMIDDTKMIPNQGGNERHKAATELQDAPKLEAIVTLMLFTFIYHAYV